MGDWKSTLNADPIDWLLETDEPSVRYFTMRDILDKPEDDPIMQKARQNIMDIGIVPALLEKQDGDGCWEAPGRFYTAKYTGTAWQIMILAELGANGNNDRIRKACEFILTNSQDRESGGFSMATSLRSGGGLHSKVVPCLTGNMVWGLIRMGCLEDPRLRRGIDWITTYQRFDDGIEKSPKGWPYDISDMCWGRHTCHMGVVKSLKALAEIPEHKRTSHVNATISKSVEYLLIHRIYKRSHDLARVSKPGWRKFGFPLMYQTDILEILGILAGLGIQDARMQEAVDLLVSKQDEHGKWAMENTFNGHVQIDIEQKGEPSKWITLNALRILKRYYG